MLFYFGFGFGCLAPAPEWLSTAGRMANEDRDRPSRPQKRDLSSEDWMIHFTKAALIYLPARPFAPTKQRSERYFQTI